MLTIASDRKVKMMNNFLATFRVWLRDRELKTVSCFTVGTIAHDLWECSLDLMIDHTDKEYICYRIDFVCIDYFTVGGEYHG